MYYEPCPTADQEAMKLVVLLTTAIMALDFGELVYRAQIWMPSISLVGLMYLVKDVF